MLHNIYLYNYNNYFNRIVKREEEVDDYGIPLQVIPNFNFSPNDGVTARIIVNAVYNATDSTPDYCLIVDNNGDIMSRWFVTEAKHNAQNQFIMDLRRDLVADYYDVILEAPAIIERATITDSNNPLYFNKEGFSCNQIKQSETLLFDNSKMAWIVGYLAPNAIPNDGITININPNIGSLSYEGPSTEWSEWEYCTLNPDFTVKAKVLTDIEIDIFEHNNGEIAHGYHRFTSNNKGQSVTPFTPAGSTFPYAFLVGNYQRHLRWVNDITHANFSSVKGLAELVAYDEGYLDPSEKPEMDAVNTYVHFTDLGKYYKVTNGVQTARSINLNSGTIKTELNRICREIEESSGATTFEDVSTTSVVAIGDFYAYELEPMSGTISEETITIPANIRKAGDVPYTVFAIPYNFTGEGSWTGIENGVSTTHVPIANVGMSIARGIMEAFNVGETAALYDVQMLPYCPIQENVESMVFSQRDPDTSVINYVRFNDDVVMFASKANFNFRIYHEIPIADEPKIESETSFYRLCSPNYSGQYEFDPQKMYGVTYFDVDCKYQPITPYIHVKPRFDGLYGPNFEKDARGLICGGDFSLDAVNSAWIEYQNQNKNYQNIFDRQISNMELHNSIASEMDQIKAITGGITGASVGAIGGAQVGGGYGAIAGAALGGVGGVATGIMDVKNNALLRQEDINFNRENFNFQLGNIKAMPLSLTKVSAINSDNHIIPFLEYYTCTDKEKEVLRNKLKYNGMTVGAIGKIQDYLSNTNEQQYIQASLIRLEGLSEEAHAARMIAETIKQGLYFGGDQ